VGEVRERGEGRGMTTLGVRGGAPPTRSSTDRALGSGAKRPGIGDGTLPFWDASKAKASA